MASPSSLEESKHRNGGNASVSSTRSSGRGGLAATASSSSSTSSAVSAVTATVRKTRKKTRASDDSTVGRAVTARPLVDRSGRLIFDVLHGSLVPEKSLFLDDRVTGFRVTIQLFGSESCQTVEIQVSGKDFLPQPQYLASRFEYLKSKSAKRLEDDKIQILRKANERLGVIKSHLDYFRRSFSLPSELPASMDGNTDPVLQDLCIRMKQRIFRAVIFKAGSSTVASAGTAAARVEAKKDE